MGQSKLVDEYIAKAAEPAQLMMKQIRAVILAVAPDAEEKISYKMPFYQYRFAGYKGRLAYYAAFKNHISFFAIPRNIPAELAKKLEQYRAAKSTLQFPIGEKIPVELLRRLVRLRKADIDAEN